MSVALSEELQILFEEQKGAIRARLDDFAAVPIEEYFYELAYCLLTPQSSARNVEQVIHILRAKNFFFLPFDPAVVLREKKHYVRFHLTKAKRLLKAREQFTDIRETLCSNLSAVDKRNWLVLHVDGLSMKEASHFLRNIGARDLAIIDRHILTHLVACRVIRRKPSSLTTKRYLAIERKFKTFARKMGIPMDELDLLFWSRETGVILK